MRPYGSVRGAISDGRPYRDEELRPIAAGQRHTEGSLRPV